jgi:hypothetical protein
LNSRHKVSLELIEIDVQGTIETERGGNAGDNLCNESVQVDERWSRDIEFTSADIVDSLVVLEKLLDSAISAEPANLQP